MPVVSNNHEDPSRSSAKLPPKVHVVLPHDLESVFVAKRADVTYVPPAMLIALADGCPLIACPAFASAFASSGTASRRSRSRPGHSTTPAVALQAAAAAVCPHGHGCTLAHVVIDVSRGPQFRQHRCPSGGWPALAAVPYPRFPATATVGHPDGQRTCNDDNPSLLDLQAPNVPGVVLESVPAAACLRTRALEPHEGSRLTHCAHWLLKRVCQFGAACKFVHVAQPSEAAIATTVARVEARRGSFHGLPSGITSSLTSPTNANAPSTPTPRSYPFTRDPYTATPRSITPPESPT